MQKPRKRNRSMLALQRMVVMGLALIGTGLPAGGTLSQEAYLKASNPDSYDFFSVVAMSGNTLVVGAILEDSFARGVNGNQNNNAGPNSGAVYVFARSGTNWSQEAYLKANTSPGFFAYFGKSVTLASPDLVIIGAEQEASDTTGINGPATNTGADGSGAAYVFERSAGSWAQIAYVKASNTGANDHFGAAVAGLGNSVMGKSA